MQSSLIASKIPYIPFNFIKFHDLSYDLVTTVRGNNCSWTGRAIWILPRAIVPVFSRQYARINGYHKSEFHKNFQFHQQIFSTFLHLTLIPFYFAGPSFAARPCRICQVVFIGVAALVLIIMGATWPSSSDGSSDGFSYDMPIPHTFIVPILGVLTIFSVLIYFIITCQKARFPHTCDARKDQSIWL